MKTIQPRHPAGLLLSLASADSFVFHSPSLLMKHPLLLLLLILSACVPHYVKIAPDQLPSYLAQQNEAAPLVSAHRGGKYYPGRPENSLAAFRYVLKHTPALIECDVRMSRDSVLLLMHDQELERTTNGTGEVSDFEWMALRKLRLEDAEGDLTRHRIPRLEKVLRWTQGKAILTLDVKREVPWEQVIAAVRAAEAEDYVVLITYDFETATAVHALAPDLMLSVSVPSLSEWKRYEQGAIPVDQLIVFSGTRLSHPALYEAISHSGPLVMLGTMGEIDAAAQVDGGESYRTCWDQGIRVLATDYPVEAAAVAD